MSGLAEHAGIALVSQVREHALANVNAFADVQRQLSSASEEVHARTIGELGGEL
jgi:hypothetical protein